MNLRQPLLSKSESSVSVYFDEQKQRVISAEKSNCSLCNHEGKILGISFLLSAQMHTELGFSFFCIKHRPEGPISLAVRRIFYHEQRNGVLIIGSDHKEPLGHPLLSFSLDQDFSAKGSSINFLPMLEKHPNLEQDEMLVRWVEKLVRDFDLLPHNTKAIMVSFALSPDHLKAVCEDYELDMQKINDAEQEKGLPVDKGIKEEASIPDR